MYTCNESDYTKCVIPMTGSCMPIYSSRSSYHCKCLLIILSCFSLSDLRFANNYFFLILCLCFFAENLLDQLLIVQMTAHLSIMRPSPYAMPPSRIPPSMQYGHRTAPGQQQQQQQHSGAPFSVAPTSTFYHPSTFQNHPMLMQGSHVRKDPLCKWNTILQY